MTISDDLASLVAPRHIVLCEGSADKHVEGFDAKCYNLLFADEHSETLFLSRGGSNEVIQSKHLMAILETIAEGTRVIRLVDRDDMTKEARDRKISDEIRVLRRRELEDYLYHPAVLSTFCMLHGCKDSIRECILQKQRDLIESQEGPRNVKDISQSLFTAIRKSTKLENLGNNREEFAVHFLVPALQMTRNVFDELREDIFGA